MVVVTAVLPWTAKGAAAPSSARQFNRRRDNPLEGSNWTLLLWVCEPFDDAYSFRELFATITAALETKRDVDLTLPPEEPGEDFVDGTLRWGSTAYEVYFERSLGYVQFSSPSESSTRELLDALAQDFVWPRGTDSNSA